MRGAALARRSDASRLGWGGVGLLGLACLLSFIAAAQRGIELSDEAFYWLQIRYWQQLDFHFSFFGAYLDGLFWALQQRIDLMRIAGAALIAASSGVLFWQLAGYLRWQCPDLQPPQRRLVGLAALLGLSHYAFMWTLWGPSYNTLAFMGCAFSSALLLAWLRRVERRALIGLLYGGVLGMSFLCKVTTAVMLVPLHLAVLWLHRRDWRWRDVLLLVGTSLLGVGLNVGYLTLRHPGWWQAVTDGLVFQRAMEKRDPLLSLRGVLWTWQREAPLPWIAAMGAALVAQALLLRNGSKRVAGALMVCCVAVLGLWLLITTEHRGGWLLLVGLVTASLTLQLVHGRSRWRLQPWLVVTGLAFGLPVAYSFGTNLALAEHSLMAVPFPLVGLLCGLWVLQGLGRIGSGTLALCALPLALPVLSAVTWPWLGADQTYRLRAPLLANNMPLADNLRYRGLMTDPETAQSLAALIDTVKSAGFRPGQPMIEFTGGHPGIVDVLQGQPVGVAWLLGNYPGSTVAAGMVLTRVGVDRLRHTWLITSDDASRRIVGWEALLDDRLGQRCHERVASLAFSPPHSARLDQPGQPIEISVWRPLVACVAGGSYAR